MRKLTNTELKHVYGGGIIGGILGCGSRSHHTRSYSHHGSSGCGTRTRTRTRSCTGGGPA